MSNTLASLDMYCWPENRDRWNGLWKSIHGELTKLNISAPPALTFDRPITEIWQDPNLLIGHCCGWPYISKLRDQVMLIGRFDFGAEGCAPGDYTSVFVVPKNSEMHSLDDLSDHTPRIAVNGTNSQSGFRVLHEVFENIESSEGFMITGSHRDSICAVATGQAEFAAIDAVTWELLKAYEPMIEQVKVIGRSTPRPGLPLITANGNRELVPQLYSAVRNAIGTIGEPLSILDFLPAQDSDYEILL